MIFISESQSQFTVGQSTSTTVMTIQENFMKKLDSLKELLNHTKMMTGLQLRPMFGFLKKMLKWNNIFRKNLVEEKSYPKNSFFRMIVKCSNFLQDLKACLISFTTFWQMTLFKLDKFHCQIQGETLSLLLSVDKNSPGNMHWINLDKLMLKILWKLKIFLSTKIYKFLEECILLKIVMISPEIIMLKNSELFFLNLKAK